MPIYTLLTFLAMAISTKIRTLTKKFINETELDKQMVRWSTEIFKIQNYTQKRAFIYQDVLHKKTFEELIFCFKTL